MANVEDEKAIREYYLHTLKHQLKSLYNESEAANRYSVIEQAKTKDLARYIKDLVDYNLQHRPEPTPKIEQPIEIGDNKNEEPIEIGEKIDPRDIQKSTAGNSKHDDAIIGAASIGSIGGGAGILFKKPHTAIEIGDAEDEIELLDRTGEASEVIDNTDVMDVENINDFNSGLRRRVNTNITRQTFEPLEIGEPVNIGGAAAGTALSTGSSGLSTLGVMGAIGVPVIGTAIGAAVSNQSDDKPKRGYVLPNSDYIGPGNDIHIGPARNAADQAAKEHDLEYEKIINEARGKYMSQQEFTNRIRQADKKAISEFEEDIKQTGNWQAYVGKYGLKIKSGVETLIGKPIYPRRPGKHFTSTVSVSS